MADTATTVAGKPVWVDLATSDPEAARAFYAKLFGWNIEVNTDPQYGGYALAKVGGRDVAGIGPTMAPGAPTAWSIYIGTLDGEALADRVKDAGGTVVMEPFAVGNQGTMAVFQDPSGAYISSWQASAMSGFGNPGAGTFAWAELNARGFDRDVPFYKAVFGWDTRVNPMPGGTSYTEFLLGGESIAGGQEMGPMQPAEVPSYWMAYFGVADVDAAFRTALDAGGRELVSPMDFPGGRFAIVADPQGAAFGLMLMQG